MNTPINIIYPINKKRYPKTDPAYKVKSAYVTFAFSCTISGGQNKVVWGINKRTLGKAVFYDFYNSQFVYKLPAGKHSFWVKIGSNYSKVKFAV